MGSSIRTAAFLGLALGASSIASAQIPLGPEFRVTSIITADPQFSTTADTTVMPDGSFVIAWTAAPNLPNNSLDVHYRRYRSSGRPYGPEVRANTQTSLIQSNPAIASDDSGRLVVAWASEGQDGAGFGIFAQRFDANGSPAGSEFQVNQTTTGDQVGPAVAMSPSGMFVVTWRDQFLPVRARLFDATGAPVGAEFQVSSGYAWSPTVAMDGSGNFVIAYASGTAGGAWARLYGASGAPIGSEFRVTTQGAEIVSVARRRDGPFVVAWSWSTLPPQFTDIVAQRFDGAGIPIGAVFGVPSSFIGWEQLPDVTIDAAGDFVVAWEHRAPTAGSWAVFARRFDWNSLAGTEIVVSGPASLNHLMPSVSSDQAGNFMVAWYGDPGALPGVFARRYAAGLSAAALAVDPAAGGSSDGNGVLEAGETVTVRPSWLNANFGAQSFSGTASSFVGPGAPNDPAYTIADGAAGYGTVASGATASCGGDCYALGVTVPTARPAQHWDATFHEEIAPANLGAAKNWTLHIGDSFTDVPRSSGFYRFIETLLHNSVTGGCTSSTYCPSASATREQMAVFVLVAKERTGYTPPACATPVFADVPATSPFCPWIEELARRGVVNGCGGGNYCPTAPVSREQMAVFTLLTNEPGVTPPACGTPVFNDVPASSPYCRWIEELARRGIVTGCGGGNYCPAANVTREQMAVFISATFGLVLYGP